MVTPRAKRKITTVIIMPIIMISIMINRKLALSRTSFVKSSVVPDAFRSKLDRSIIISQTVYISNICRWTLDVRLHYEYNDFQERTSLKIK